jgi:glucan phosphoethanolaminetransferase (alkaline phosphatase superfamily)
MLGLWLWLPSLAVLNTDLVQNGGEVLALLAFSLCLLLFPLVFVASLRNYFLLCSPLALLVGPYCYLTLVYHSVPGDALLSATVHTGLAMSVQVLGSFGWKLWLVPAAGLVYVLLARSLNRGWRLGREVRKRLLAIILMYSMLALVARQTLAQHVHLPPLLEQSTIDLAFPSGLANSVARVFTQSHRTAGFVSVQGRPVAGPEPLLVVLVVGESLRSDHLGINGYQRNTTPRLSALGSQVLTFSDVASTANWTNRAVPGILSRPIGKGSATLVQTFREAGFRTAWISNQESSDLSLMADVTEHATGTMDFHLRSDINLLPQFVSFVRQAGERQFIVLHMMGSHIPYEERYGADSKVFRPTLSDLGVNDPLPSNKAAVINSYDNTVIETDKFLDRVIAALQQEQRPAVLLFTSDHGENLFDDARQLFMHAQRGPTRYDTHVPMLAWMNGAYRSAYPGVANALHANLDRPISHANVFPSLLDLGAVSWQGHDPRASFASPFYTGGKREVALDLVSGVATYESLK